eukprot:TRINITY_DN7887_c0_g1_i1.p1 TRINITY_DN7887_c0_g1~~TRINITY_DN7887_c0_g1_i1.p1  ORF type:complete len:713 (+),score=140.04 TRINITY_DN7887_c0_g1_i1:80-2218(+)
MQRLWLVAIYVFLLLAVCGRANVQLDPISVSNFWISVFSATNLQSQGIVSAGVAVVARNGTVYYSQGFGYQSLTPQIPTSPSTTLFPLGALSKTFVGVAAMQAWQTSPSLLQMNLNSALETYAPEIALRNYVVGNATSFGGLPFVPTNTPPSIASCLTESAGLDTDIHWKYLSPTTPANLAPFMSANLPPRIRLEGDVAFPSPSALTLAALAATGPSVTWDSYLHSNILTPLGMLSTLPRLLPTSANVQVMMRGTKVVEPDYSRLVPADGVFSTANDLAKFAAALLNNGTYAPTNTQILQGASVSMMFQKHFSNSKTLPGLGLGWLQSAVGSVNFMEQRENDHDQNNFIRLYMEQGVGVILLTNSGHSAERWLQTQLTLFQNLIQGITPVCPGSDAPVYGCSVSAAQVPGSLVYSPQQAIARYGPMLVTYVPANYSHTTWLKYQALTQLETLSVNAQGLLQFSTGDCLVELVNPTNATEVPFYAGSVVEGICVFPYPINTFYLRAFRVADKAASYLFSQFFAIEVSAASMLISWTAVMVVFFILLFTGVIIGIPVIIVLIVRESRAAAAANEELPQLNVPLVADGHTSTTNKPKSQNAISSFRPFGWTMAACVLQALCCMLLIIELAVGLAFQMPPYSPSTGQGIVTGLSLGIVAVACQLLMVVCTCVINACSDWPYWARTWYMVQTGVCMVTLMALLEWNWLGAFFISGLA